MTLTVRAPLLHELLERGRKYPVKKGQILQSSDNRLLTTLVKSGFIKRYLIANDGSFGVQSIYGPGDIFPLTLIFKLILDQDLYHGPETYYYEAMCDSEIYILSNEVLLKQVESDPSLYRDLFSEAGRRLTSNIQRLENISLTSAYKRVAHQLVFYAKEFSEPTPLGTKLVIPLTHLDLANILSISRETVSQAMSKLRAEGLIKTNKHIIIPNLKKLEDEAYS